MAAVGLGLVTLGVGPAASAHYVNPGWFKVYDDQTTCTFAMAEIGHDGTSPYVRGGVYATDSVGFGPVQVLCAQNPLAADVSVGGLAVATNLQKVVNGVSAVCVDNGFRTNSAVVDELYVRFNTASAAPCGTGEYEARSWSYVKMNGQWSGGDVRSGGHQLPIPGGK